MAIHDSLNCGDYCPLHNSFFLCSEVASKGISKRGSPWIILEFSHSVSITVKS